ncbi:5-(carboxyamino)imidazole ribonucleotide synthase [Longibacter salinarum]|uniref:N5-carboxyaminoimidazole ribonucleotide synthase n=1 Tax=Longibacter salinarum TaxID=1850348 RepID=A0A2A8D1U6_9BACT|nr:5-(carboxyamino)imidazole ribonucleotide synthase [Longibacter salinarum]PEN14929.1 5-(carboxyamino)imidazole ribonucleotide synthase [Longibacter salinarum]
MSTVSSESFPTVGVLGGGQLGKMMAAAAQQLGVHTRLLSPKDAGPMQFFADSRSGDWRDPEVLRRFARECDVITVESEWAPAAEMAEVLPENAALRPGPSTLDLIKDKGVQNRTLAEAGLPLPPFACCHTLSDAVDAASKLGYPVVVKQYRGSYDGYGNATARDESELRQAWPDLAADDGALIEAFIPFERELAVQVARRPGGEQVTYPVAYTVQRDHRCHAVVVPAPIDEDVSERAREVAAAAVDAVDGVGLTAVELFQTEDNDILVNELAPRPHNTGHYSIEGSHTSQFENHIRAILDWPLGDPGLRANSAVMVNVLGHRDGRPPKTTGLREALSVSGAAVHIYGKPQVRPNRKMGHVTVVGDDPESVRARAEEAAAAIEL